MVLSNTRKGLLEYWKETGLIKDKKLLKAFEEVRREHFILENYANEAYGDYPLPIGYDQTISQPTTIMIMIQALELKKTDKVLEIGAGSGYNAALMARLSAKVYSIEIVKELVSFARDNLSKAKITNVEVVHSDGSMGYLKEAPYDKIMVTAACPNVPVPLIEQLREKGIVVAPVGGFLGQKMIKGRKIRGMMEYEPLGDFQFVPLKGKFGQ
jgi:protein-L-isoaspartate(D-aspartate) O-methyltransferase